MLPVQIFCAWLQKHWYNFCHTSKSGSLEFMGLMPGHSLGLPPLKPWRGLQNQLSLISGPQNYMYALNFTSYLYLPLD